MRKVLFHNKKLFALYVIISGIAMGVVGYFTMVIQAIVDMAGENNKQGIIDKMILGAIIVVVILVLGTLQSYILQYYKNSCLYYFRDSYYTNLLKMNYSKLSKYDSSQHISSLTNDAEIISTNFIDNIMGIIEDAFVVVVSFIVMLIISPTMTFIMVGLTLILAIVPGLLKKQMDRRTHSYSLSLRNFTDKLKEVLLGLRIIKSNNAEEAFSAELTVQNREILDNKNALSRTNIAMISASTLCNNSFLLILIGVSSLLVVAGSITVGAIIAVMNLSSRFLGCIQQIANKVVMVLSTSTLRKSIEPFLDYENTGENEKAELVDKSNLNIKLANVNFSYSDERSHFALTNINVQFEKNKKYLVLGKSGSGKSTLLKLMSKLIEENTGDIYIGKSEYRNVSNKNINDVVALAQQDTYLFKTTLQRNIDLLGTNDVKKLQKAIDGAQLDDFIERLPNGIDTVIDEEVNQVSGGEKLRINLARALYKDSAILLLDEVTSSVDRSTAQKIETDLLRMQDKTIVNVSHKFEESTLQQYDQIIIIENGEIALNDTYENLKDNSTLLSYRGKVR